MHPNSLYSVPPPLEIRVPPHFQNSSIKSLILPFLTRFRVMCMMRLVCDSVCVCVNPCLFVVTGARCQSWSWVCSSLRQSSCYTFGESTHAHKTCQQPLTLHLGFLTHWTRTKWTNEPLPSHHMSHRHKLDLSFFFMPLCRPPSSSALLWFPCC